MYTVGSKTVWRFLKKKKNGTTIWPSNSTPGYISEKDKNTNLKRCIHSNVHSSTIFNSQDMEVMQVAINRWLAEEDLIYTPNELLFSHKKKEILPFAATWMDLENITLSETCWTEKDKYYMIITYMWNLKNTNEHIYKTNWLTDIDKDLVTRRVTQGEKGKDEIASPALPRIT